MVMLVTAAELASHLQKDVDTATAEQKIAAYSAWVESQTGMAFTARTATIRIPATAAQQLVIPLRPLRTVATVKIGSTTLTDFTLADGMLWRARGWRTSFTPEMVDVTVGYGLTVTPADVKEVVLEAAGLAYDVPAGVESEAIDDYRVSYIITGQLSETSRATLAAYGANVAALSFTGR